MQDVWHEIEIPGKNLIVCDFSLCIGKQGDKKKRVTSVSVLRELDFKSTREGRIPPSGPTKVSVVAWFALSPPRPFQTRLYVVHSDRWRVCKVGNCLRARSGAFRCAQVGGFQEVLVQNSTRLQASRTCMCLGGWHRFPRRYMVSHLALGKAKGALCRMFDLSDCRKSNSRRIGSAISRIRLKSCSHTKMGSLVSLLGFFHEFSCFESLDTAGGCSPLSPRRLFWLPLLLTT